MEYLLERWNNPTAEQILSAIGELFPEKEPPGIRSVSDWKAKAWEFEVGLTEMLVTNAIFLLVTCLLESERWLKHTSSKLILYDRIQLITPDKREELIADLSARTGLHIQKIEIGHIDFLRDAAFIKVYYESDSRETNTVDHLTKFPKEGE